MNNSFQYFAVSLLFACGQAYGQSCNFDQIPVTTPDERFLSEDTGVVIDIETALMWKACPEGQIFDNGNCKGLAREYTFETGLQHAVQVNSDLYAGYDDWRVPNIKELSSIVERACFDPAINLTVFPSSPSTAFLSSTPDYSGAGASRYVYFVNGAGYAPEVSAYRNLRLVRSVGELETDF